VDKGVVIRYIESVDELAGDAAVRAAKELS